MNQVMQSRSQRAIHPCFVENSSQWKCSNYIIRLRIIYFPRKLINFFCENGHLRNKNCSNCLQIISNFEILFDLFTSYLPGETNILCIFPNLLRINRDQNTSFKSTWQILIYILPIISIRTWLIIIFFIIIKIKKS